MLTFCCEIEINVCCNAKPLILLFCSAYYDLIIFYELYYWLLIDVCNILIKYLFIIEIRSMETEFCIFFWLILDPLLSNVVWLLRECTMIPSVLWSQALAHSWSNFSLNPMWGIPIFIDNLYYFPLFYLTRHTRSEFGLENSYSMFILATSRVWGLLGHLSPVGYSISRGSRPLQSSKKNNATSGMLQSSRNDSDLKFHWNCHWLDLRKWTKIAIYFSE